MTLLGAICTQFPDARFALIFLPFFTFSAKSVMLLMRERNSIRSFESLGSYLNGVLWSSWHIDAMALSWSFSPFRWSFVWRVSRWEQAKKKKKKETRSYYFTTRFQFLFRFYVKYGYKLLWDSLIPVVKQWHQLREKIK